MEIKLIDITYKDLFNKLNVTFKTGEINAIVGKNASGKTSILNLIFGIDLNFKGKICIGESFINNSKKNSNIKKIRKNIAYLRQDYLNDLFNINILEDIKYSNSNFDEAKLYDLLKLFKLKENILKKCYLDLSSGEIKKILLIKLFMSNANIIILDEPTNGLDNFSALNLIKLLKREKRDGKTIIISSTDSEFLIKIAEKFLILHNKNSYEISNKYEFLSNDTLLNSVNLCMPKIIDFKLNSLKIKKIKLIYRDNTNDLLKDIYRSIDAK